MGHSMLDYIIAPALILLIALFVLIGILYCCIKINCCQRNSDNSCDDLSMRHETGPPPSYSGLSLHLPPSYSQACRIIGYRRSCDDVSGVQTNPAFECEADGTGSVSSLSQNNVINFSNSHSDVVASNE